MAELLSFMVSLLLVFCVWAGLTAWLAVQRSGEP